MEGRRKEMVESLVNVLTPPSSVVTADGTDGGGGGGGGGLGRSPLTSSAAVVVKAVGDVVEQERELLTYCKLFFNSLPFSFPQICITHNDHHGIFFPFFLVQM